MPLLSYFAAVAVLALPEFGHWIKNGIINLVSVFFVLGVLVFVHEFGHYAMAKWFGVRVEVFSLGFGKRLWGFRRGDTDYRISALPLGGYVKMSGENIMEARTGDPGEFTSHPRWQRFLIAIAGPAMNILLAIVVLTGLYMYRHDYEAVLRIPVDVVWVTPDSPAAKAGIQKGDRVIKIEDVQNPTWEQLLKTEFIPEPLSLTIQRGDRTLNMKVVPEAKGPDRVGDLGLEPPEVVGTLEPGHPADLAGVKEGDILVAVDNAPVKNVPEMLELLQKTQGKQVQLTVLREGKEVTLPITPQLLPTPGASSKAEYRLGFAVSRTEKLPFAVALRAAYLECKENSSLIFKLLGKLVQRHPPIQQLSGPIGIMQISGRAARTSFPTLLSVLALISLNLAVLNLLPIPILDGGLMLMLLIEGALRRDIKLEIKERVYQAAFVFLLLFFAVVIFNDLAKSFHS